MSIRPLSVYFCSLILRVVRYNSTTLLSGSVLPDKLKYLLPTPTLNSSHFPLYTFDSPRDFLKSLTSTPEPEDWTPGLYRF